MSLFFESAVFEHQFWLRILGDHSRFIHDSLYPSEKEDIAKAARFIQIFDQLLGSVEKQNESTMIPFTKQVEDHVNHLKAFKLSIIRRHITGEIKIHLTPSFVNHMVNELEEYQRIIGFVGGGEIPPIFHELHHHLLWLLDASGHAGAINDRLDGVERRLKEKSHNFTMHFDHFYLKAVELTGFLRTNVHKFPALSKFNEDVEIEMNLFKTFLHELEEMELNAESLGIFSALMADHMAREEQYYLMKLAQSKSV
ncbi:DUF2935 domain-containing protein [Ureibacillus sinduriensis]|uniref:DUF2935 domain-containing protein n=1 Tax=Ureibacillus sinduriensis BLB-1 = JCM 15800 TaxID=1384057 RepID=A0A0A3HR98_9BACL|nr:DUF2935 domain-containing protein [Ureibacillus sinduriensis]KGR73740.1 hypothetical protein CD33_17130 [Ureibacillus sinduriensis BLB-1 = JCM 15800]